MSNNPLPTIPDKVYFPIREVSTLCALKPHVLRYWEQEFPQLRPCRRGNRRYYQRDDVILVRKIRNLLYNQGFTIEGARNKLLSKADAKELLAHEKKELLAEIAQGLEKVLAELEVED